MKPKLIVILSLMMVFGIFQNAYSAYVVKQLSVAPFEDNYAPQINAKGQVVWHGRVGEYNLYISDLSFRYSMINP